MTQKVRAAVKVNIETTEIQHFDRPTLAADSALLRVESAGVGGSDPELYRKPNHVPIIMGHENVGTIEDAGKLFMHRWGMAPGDRVALHEYLPCYHCRWCLQGDFRLCEEVDFFTIKDRLNTLRFGMSKATMAPYLWGGFSQYLHLPLNAVMHRLPATLDARWATLAIPFGNGYQWAVLDGGARPGKTVLVFGPGQQGLGCVLASKAAGADQVILVGMSRDRRRLDLACRLGADHVIDIERSNLGDEVMSITRGRGVDVVVDTTGDDSGKVAKEAVLLAAKGAHLNLNGLDQSIPIGAIKQKYLTVRAPRGHSYKAVELALQQIGSGRWPLDEVCSHDFSLSETHSAILATAGREIADAVHVTVDPWR